MKLSASPSRLTCVGPMTPQCRAGQTQAYFAIARERPCGHHEKPIPMCRDCIGGKDPRVNVTAIIGQARRKTPCTRCGVESRLLMRLLMHFAVPAKGTAHNQPLCFNAGDMVLFDHGGTVVRYPATDVPLVQGHTLIRSQVNCTPCLEAMRT